MGCRFLVTAGVSLCEQFALLVLFFFLPFFPCVRLTALTWEGAGKQQDRSALEVEVWECVLE